MNLPHGSLSTVALCILSASAASCSKSGPAPEKEPLAAQTSASLVQSAAPSANAASAEQQAPKTTIPTLAPEPFEGTKGMTVDFYPIEGALTVVSGLRVGRIVDERVEWFATLPETNEWLGGSQINGVQGTWPDGVNVLYSSNNGRASQPSIYPLTGKGAAVTFASGGGFGWISGTARLGKTVLVGGNDMQEGYRFQTLRGPGLVINPITGEKGGCTEEDPKTFWGGPSPIAVPIRGAAATENGTLVTVGNLCEREDTPAAEVWDQPGKSRIIELGAWVKDLSYFARLLVGKGDDLWLESHPVLHYNGGKFAPLPKLEKRVGNLFVSPAGKLHGISGRALVRYDEGKWTTIANLQWPMSFATIGMDEKGTIWVSHNGVSRLREQSGADVAGGCKTPFVYLYEVSWRNEPKYTFPTTRKALSTFPEIADVTLMEYWEGRRILGVQVKSEQQGEAVIAHVKANMKNEHPELICYAPKKPRVIEMKPGK
jgi:hypothetical protein